MTEENFTPESCRRQAIVWRAKAVAAADEKSKHEMLRIATEFDRLGDTLAALGGGEEQPRQ
jgi:hypothetical protein